MSLSGLSGLSALGGVFGASGPATLPVDLYAFWSLEEESGNRVDATGNGHTLTDNGTVTSNPGKVGTAAQFTLGEQERLTRTDANFPSFGDIDFTIAGWAFLDTVGATQPLVSKFASSPQREWMLYYLSGTNRFQWRVTGDGSTQTTLNANSLGAPVVSTWYFIVCWHDAAADTISIQVNNGTADSTAHTAGVFNSTADFMLGAHGAFEYFQGRLDQWGVWKRVLTAAERTYLYNSGAGRSYAEIAAASP